MVFFKSYKVKLLVEGLHCKHCAKVVEDKVKEISGVKSVKVILAKGEVLVKSSLEIADDDLNNIFGSLDYELKEILR